jgi:hypothetical protein
LGGSEEKYEVGDRKYDGNTRRGGPLREIIKGNTIEIK